VKALSGIKLTEELVYSFNYSLWIDFFNNYSGQLGVIFSYLFLIGFLYLILNIFLSGGLISIWRNDSEEYDRNMFFINCVEYFFRFIKIFLYILVLIIILLIFLLFIFAFIDSISKSIYSGNTVNLLYIAGLTLILFLLSVCIIIYDYARIILIKDIATSGVKSVIYSIKFVSRNFFGVYSIFVILFFIFLFSTVIYMGLKYFLSVTNWGLFLFILILQQIYILFRIYLRVIMYSSQYRYHENKI
jgi:hypothetical protein